MGWLTIKGGPVVLGHETEVPTMVGINANLIEVGWEIAIWTIEN